MRPQLSIGVANQKLWPKAGDTDDCFAVATIQAALAVMPWLSAPNIRRFREAAGNPDDPRFLDGGSIRQCAQAIRTLWPELGALITVSDGRLTKVDVLARIKAGRVAMLFIMAGYLPVDQQYGFFMEHAVAVAWDGGEYVMANPLAPAHSRWKAVPEAALAEAIKKFPGDRAFGILMPTLEEAAATHPLLAGLVASAVAAATTSLSAQVADLKEKVRTARTGGIDAARLASNTAIDALRAE